MSRAEQQLTRVKVDIIRCHSHFLPKTQCTFPPPVSSCLFPPEGDGVNKKEAPISDAVGLWSIKQSLVNAVEVVLPTSRLILYSFSLLPFVAAAVTSDRPVNGA